MIWGNKTVAARKYFQNFGLRHGRRVIYFSYHTLAADKEEFAFSNRDFQSNTEITILVPTRIPRTESAILVQFPQTELAVPTRSPVWNLARAAPWSAFWRVRSNEAAASAAFAAVGYVRDDGPTPKAAFVQDLCRA